MPVGDPLDPVLYSWWVLALGIVLVLGALAWVLWVLRRPRTVNYAQMVRDRKAPQVRITYGQQLEELFARFQRREIDPREFHLEVAELVRKFGSERMGRDLSTMSRSEVERFAPGTELGPLLARCEEPSFARDPQSIGMQTFQWARQVITQW